MASRTLARPWRGRRIVLGVTGGIAAYKSVQLARDLTLAGAEVDVILTRAARKFVGRVSFEGVTGRAAFASMWSASGGRALHLDLANRAELLIVAPATADFLAQAAGGRAEDLLAAVFLATDAPVLLAPAMNERMWTHPFTRRNVDALASLERCHLVGPGSGPLGAGEDEGEGRMVDPSELLDRAGGLLSDDESWRGRRVLVTAGPTHEPVDPVRFVGNRSSGRMGYAIAREAALRGAHVVLVSGPSALPDPVGVETIRVTTAREMLAAVRERAPDVDVAVYAAAVADYRPSEPAETKRRKDVEGDALELHLVLNPDIARESGELLPPHAVRVGFALESEDLVERARAKMQSKGFDLVVANPSGDDDAGFESVTNRVTLIDRGGDAEAWPVLGKDEVARRILDRVTPLLDRADGRDRT